MSESVPTSENRINVGARRLARVYAEALLRESQARGTAQETLEDLEALLREVIDATPETRQFFGSAIISRERKAEAIDRALRGRVSELVLNYVMTLNAHERLELFRPSLTLYRELLEDLAGQMRVQVRSAMPLEPHQQERLRDELRQAFRREPLLDLHVDADLLGGMVVKVGDWLYDASVRTRLEVIRDELSERSSHEIQVGRDRFCSDK